MDKAPLIGSIYGIVIGGITSFSKAGSHYILMLNTTRQKVQVEDGLILNAVNQSIAISLII